CVGGRGRGGRGGGGRGGLRGGGGVGRGGRWAGAEAVARRHLERVRRAIGEAGHGHAGGGRRSRHDRRGLGGGADEGRYRVARDGGVPADRSGPRHQGGGVAGGGGDAGECARQCRRRREDRVDPVV